MDAEEFRGELGWLFTLWLWVIVVALPLWVFATGKNAPGVIRLRVIVFGTLATAVEFGTIAYGLLRLGMLRGDTPTIHFHRLFPPLPDYRPAGLPNTETLLDRVLLGVDRRLAGRYVAVAAVTSAVLGGLPTLLPELVGSPAGYSDPGDHPVAAGVFIVGMVIAIVHAAKNRGVLACWAIGKVFAVGLAVSYVLVEAGQTGKFHGVPRWPLQMNIAWTAATVGFAFGVAIDYLTAWGLTTTYLPSE